MNVVLKDGSAHELRDGASVYELARDLSEGLARVVLAGEVNGELQDLRHPLREGDQVNLLTFDQPGGKLAFWHSTSHIMAQAIKRLYPEAKLAIGPAIENGFYYDIDYEPGFTAEDLEKIEAEMKKIVKADYPIERFELPRQEALELMRQAEEPYKVELINDLPQDAVISFYRQGEFTDLCAGPHIMSTKAVKAIKLLSVAGAYWRGSEKNKMLTRIYGISYPKKAELDEYLAMLEEAKRRDHRKIGKEMGLFMLSDEGPGFPFFLPNGMILMNTLLDYWHQIHAREGYVEISTPIILSRKLWENSGHWDHYKNNMYTTVIDGEDYAVKPMNCPGSMLVYKSQPHSYRDLPLRMAEVGLVHRHEKSGQLNGLLRVRSFHQDDAHIFMTPEQVRPEIENVARLVDEVYRTFGFDYFIELSTRPEDSMGTDEEWELATNALKGALADLGRDYIINEGDGAFYGPKIDFHLRDCMGRTWQCGTIQLDFQMPQRFELEYTGADGSKHRPIMLHRVVYGSIERFMAMLIEQFAGKFPLWLAPEQVRILPISEKLNAYGETVLQQLRQAGLRASIDKRDDKVGYKVRQAQLEKVPYMLVVGAKEEETKTVSLRRRDTEKSESWSLEQLLPELKSLIEQKSLTL
ncbi:MAG: threonine--tRNA ligase [Oscillospiraceae bacterium]|nr:threonine--tRNA ligase [Oscillospiraceae bacterium]MDD4368411.1 threonine--tRNA ligase [Oscillospiraceae bacterium]